MALSNDAYNGWTGIGYGTYRLHMYSWVVSQNISANTSQVRSQVWVESSAGSSFDFNSTHYQSIAGQVTLNNVVIRRAMSGSSAILVMDNEVTVPHNADGTKTINCYAAFYNGITGTLAISRDWTIDTIPRASTPSWTGNFVANATSSYGTVINTNRASTSFTHDITYTFGGASGTIGTGVGASVTWTPPVSLLSQIPNSTSGVGTLTTVTKSGSTTIGTVNQNFTLVADGDIVPDISAITWSDDNTTVATNIGAYVQGVSRVKGIATSSGIQGSTITSETLTIGGTTVNENVPVLITSSGTISAFGTCVDSRGRTDTLTSNFTALAYTVPTINSWQVRRATSAGVVDEVAGTYLRMDLNAAVSSLVVPPVTGTEKNAMTIQVRTRPTGGAWTNRNTITPGLTYNTNVLITGGGVYNITNSYEVEITVSDKTGATAAKVIGIIPTATVALDLNGTSVGIGKYHTQGALDVNGAIYASGLIDGASLVSDGNLTVAGETYLNGTEIQGDGKTMLRYSDAWLRINEDNDFTAGIYCGSGILRTDGNLQVGPSGSTLNVTGSTFTYGGNAVGIPGQNGLPYRMSAGSTTTSASGQVTVTLPPGGGSRFTVAPIITTQVPFHPNVSVGYVSSIGTTSFNLGAFTIGGARIAATVHWQAVQMLPGSAAG